jgi:hypothetical protein
MDRAILDTPPANAKDFSGSDGRRRRIPPERRGIEPGHRWWHVPAYADYDLAVANVLGLTTVFLRRTHSRPGPAA